jgi:putative radical SAM enzyme (TIGR03279 family)
LIERVEYGSTGWRLGIRPGDRLVAVNGARPRDWLDFRFEVVAPRVSLDLWREGTGPYRVETEKAWDDDLGLRFRAPLFDGVRKCRNRCLFCFLDQLPAGLRRTLYVRDDDYRLSFLNGNYVTLTNLDAADLERIRRQRLSPLRVSIHATDPAVRRRLMGCPPPGEILPLLRDLVAAGIFIHGQVVLCPGYNDAEVLEATWRDLEPLVPGLASLAVVPVGLTRYHRRGLVPVDAEGAARVVAWAERHQARLRRRWGRAVIYLADELYLRAGLPFPSACAYDGFPQLENGVGLAVHFLQGWSRQRPYLPRHHPRGLFRVTIATGRAAARVLAPVLEDLASVRGLEVELIAVPSPFWGERVDVAGLLTASDLEEALAPRRGKLGDVVLVPGAAVDGEGRFLDDGRLPDLARRLGGPLRAVATPAELRRAALGLAPAGKAGGGGRSRLAVGVGPR